MKNLMVKHFGKVFKPFLQKIDVPMQWNFKKHKKLNKKFESQINIINKYKDDNGNIIENIHFINHY